MDESVSGMIISISRVARRLVIVVEKLGFPED